MVHDWEGIEGDTDCGFKEGKKEISSIMENAVNIGIVKRCINLMEHTKKNPHLSLTPGMFGYAFGDRNPSEILIKV